MAVLACSTSTALLCRWAAEILCWSVKIFSGIIQLKLLKFQGKPRSEYLLCLTAFFEAR